jgi:hypothetical protein
MATGWRRIGDAWYWFDDSGAMATGWRLIGGEWYLFRGSGAMASSIWAFDGLWWYWLQPSGAMARNQHVDGPYWVDASGRMYLGGEDDPSDEDDGEALYDYDLFFLNPAKTFYTGVFQALYVRTDAPSASVFYLRSDCGDINVMSGSSYDDLELQCESGSNYSRAEGGYVVELFFGKPGEHTLSVVEKDGSAERVVRTYRFEVKDTEEARIAWADGLIAQLTNDSQSPVEKLSVISAHLLKRFHYTLNQGGRIVTLAREAGVPGALKGEWDSYVSPAMLCVIAERIGGFEDIHNCYGDYRQGTPEWQMKHYLCRVTYQGQEHYFSACPSVSTGKVDSVTPIDLADASQLYPLG